jgi:2,5-diamino-6-(ribosylamino)-4(3H)-pyrimidinone 5'-phosphate reductase
MDATVFISDREKTDILVVMNTLYRAGIRSMLAEGSGTLLTELFRLSCVDELSIYVAPKIFGGATAPTLADGPGFSVGQAPLLRLVSAEGFDKAGGVLLNYLVNRLRSNLWD